MKTFLLTGASSGIGLSCLNLLLKEHSVVAISRFPPPIDHPHLTFFSEDLSKPLSSHLKKQLKSFSFDGLIFSAGKGLFGHLEELSSNEIARLFALNLFSPIFLTQYLLGGLKKKKRSDVVFIGSQAAKKAEKQNTIYGSSKAGLSAFAKSLRKEVASSGIKVSLIEPGMCQTPFYDSLHFSPKNDPLHTISPDEIAKALKMVLDAPDSTVFEEILIVPQKHAIAKKIPLP